MGLDLNRIVTRWASKLSVLAEALQQPDSIPSILSLNRRGVPGSMLRSMYLHLRQPWLLQHNIDTVIDAGASIGKFVTMIRVLLPKAMIYAFEPLPDCFTILQSRCQAMERCTAFNIALGDIDGELQFRKCSHADSSSFRPKTQFLKDSYADIDYSEEPIMVPVRTLDGIAEKLGINGNVLCKIDVEGFEDKVLTGGEHIVGNACVVIIEAPFRELYQGQMLFDDILQWMQRRGFSYYGNVLQQRSLVDGRIIGTDCIFEKCARN